MEIVDGVSQVGGGSLPGEALPTRLVALVSSSFGPDEIIAGFRRNDPPIFGRVGDDRFLLDLRTVTDLELEAIASAAERFFPY